MIKNLHLLQQLKKELNDKPKSSSKNNNRGNSQGNPKHSAKLQKSNPNSASPRAEKGKKAPAPQQHAAGKKSPSHSQSNQSQSNQSRSNQSRNENLQRDNTRRDKLQGNGSQRDRLQRDGSQRNELQHNRPRRDRGLVDSRELTLSNHRTIIYSNGVLNPQKGLELAEQSSNTSDPDYPEILNLTAAYCEGYNCTCFYDGDKKISHPIINGILKIHPKGFGFVETKKHNYFITPRECQKALNNAEVGIVEFTTDRGMGANIKRINPNYWEKTLVRVNQVSPLLVTIDGDNLEQSFSLDLSKVAAELPQLSVGMWFLAHPQDVEAKLKNQGEIVFVADSYLGHDQDPNLAWQKTQALRSIPVTYPAQDQELGNTDQGERLDLTQIPFFSIDNASTQDIDDLVYFLELDSQQLAQAPTIELTPQEQKFFSCQEEIEPQQALYQEKVILEQLHQELAEVRQAFSNNLANIQQKATYYRERHQQQLADGLINPESGEAQPEEVLVALLANKRHKVKIFTRADVEQAQAELASLSSLSNPEEALLLTKIAEQEAKIANLAQGSFEYPTLKAYPFPEYLQAANLKVPANSKYLLAVAIADPSHFFSAGSDIDQAALSLGQSHFLPAKTIYMIDRNVSIKYFSLLEGEERPALVSFIYFDADYRLLATEIRVSTVKNHAKLDYQSTSDYLEASGYFQPKHGNQLHSQPCSNQLQGNLLQSDQSQGNQLPHNQSQDQLPNSTLTSDDAQLSLAIQTCDSLDSVKLTANLEALARFYLGRHHYRINHQKPMINSVNNSDYQVVDGRCLDIHTVPMRITNDIIGECMISNNSALSRFCFAKGIQAIYNQQSGFSAREAGNAYSFLEYLRDYEGIDVGSYLSRDKEALLNLSFAEFTQLYRHLAQQKMEFSEFLNRFMATSSFSYQAQPHAGIGEELYSSFTSPIRKYLDLHNQRNLKAYLWNEEQSQLAETDIATIIEVRNQMRTLNRELTNLYSEQYLQQHQDDTFILEVNYCFTTGLAVLDTKTNLKGFIHSNKIGEHKDSFKYICTYAVEIDGQILKVGDQIQGKLLRSNQGKNLFKAEKILN